MEETVQKAVKESMRLSRLEGARTGYLWGMSAGLIVGLIVGVFVMGQICIR